MASFHRFEEIEAWQKARELTKAVYAYANGGRFGKDSGLPDQICRAAVSVMSNIAEGFGRGGNAECRRFLSIAIRISRRGRVATLRGLGSEMQIPQTVGSFALPDVAAKNLIGGGL